VSLQPIILDVLVVVIVQVEVYSCGGSTRPTGCSGCTGCTYL